MTQIGGEDGVGGGGGVGRRQGGQVHIRDMGWGGERRKGDVEVERWSEVGVGSTSCEVETARLGPQATPFLSGVFNLRHQS